MGHQEEKNYLGKTFPAAYKRSLFVSSPTKKMFIYFDAGACCSFISSFVFYSSTVWYLVLVFVSFFLHLRAFTFHFFVCMWFLLHLLASLLTTKQSQSQVTVSFCFRISVSFLSLSFVTPLL
ncbi:hypothetical protein ACSQ67_009073 [Phaseolus vulgaris]